MGVPPFFAYFFFFAVFLVFRRLFRLRKGAFFGLFSFSFLGFFWGLNFGLFAVGFLGVYFAFVKWIANLIAVAFFAF